MADTEITIDVEAFVKRYNARRPQFNMYRSYSRGDHQLKFVDDDFRNTSGNEYKSLRENLCGAVISAFVDRLSVADWGSPANTSLAQQSFLDSALKTAWSEAFRCGNGYIIASRLETGVIIPITQRADQVITVANQTNPFELDLAYRFWRDNDGSPHVSVFDATTVQDFVHSSKGEANDVGGFKDSDFPTSGWTQNEAPTAHGFDRVPVVQFRQSSEDAWDDGMSILNDVIPIQDALNQSLANTLVLSNNFARPFWYLLNYKPKGAGDSELSPRQQALMLASALGETIDPTTLPPDSGATTTGAKFDRSKQRIFATDSPGPFGQLDPPDVTKLLEVQDKFALKIARVVGMPSYYLTQTTGDVPSGESLRVLSSRMTSRIENFQTDSNSSLIRLGELFGMADTAPTWASAAPIDETELIDIAVKKYRNLGYALEDSITILGEEDAKGIVSRATPPAQGLF